MSRSWLCHTRAPRQEKHLKGWVDRVFAMGRTYGGERLYANGVFKGKRAMLSLTTGGPQQAYLKGAFNGDISAILWPIHRGLLQFVGFEVLAPQIVYGPIRLDELSEPSCSLRHASQGDRRRAAA